MLKKLSAPLSKEDIELRIGSTSEKGFSLLLYKTARTDVRRLNEVCGNLWKNRHFYDDKGLICCEISIYDKEIGEWISRTDVGTESHTEKEKGSYSDSFKRAGFRWGIWLELYNSPFIWINWEMSAFKSGNKTVYRPKNFFSSNLKITRYSVVNGEPTFTIVYDGKKVVFDNYVEIITQEQVSELEELLAKTNSNKQEFLKFFKVGRLEELSVSKYQKAVEILNKKGAK